MISIHKKTDKQASLRTVLTSVAGLLLPATMMLCACSGSSVKGRDHDHEHEGQDAHNVVLEEEQMKAVDIKLGKIERRNLNSSVRVNGRTALAPQYRASVTSLVGGVIRSITVIEGNLVQKGQTVAYIENTDIVALQRDYLSNRSAMIAAEQEHNRQKELAKAGAGVQKDLQQATAACHIAKAQLLGVVSQLRQLGISEATVKNGNLVTRIAVKAPITGYVDKIMVSVGGYVDMQTPIMAIVDNKHLHCDLSIFEKDMTSIKAGQEVDLILTNRPDARIKGVIYETNASFEGNTKSVKAHARITGKPADLKLIPDMYLTALVHTGRHDTEALPSDAIVSHEGKKYIFLLKETEGKPGHKHYHFSREEVATGVTELGYTQITPLTKLPADATVVTSGAFYLSSMVGGPAPHSH